MDASELLRTAGLPADILDDRENRIPYPAYARLLLACEQRSHCDCVALLIARHSRLRDTGLVGMLALCAETAGEGLQRLVRHFVLHSGASTVYLLTSGRFARFAHAICDPGVADTRQVQLGALSVMHNVLQDLFGRAWRPVSVTIASSAPRSLRPVQKFFRAPLRFDADQSAIEFESRWLDARLPPVDPTFRHQIEALARAHQAEIRADFPTTVRRVLRKQLLVGGPSMSRVAELLGMSRRTLDRLLQRNGTQFGELAASVKAEVARQLLRDTQLQNHEVATSLHFSNAANFATAFRRWTGVTPSAFRRPATGLSAERDREPHEQ